MFDFKSLPVSPEFVETLQEIAFDTALEHMKSINASEDLINLVKDIHEFSYYLTQCYRDPKCLIGDPADRFNIEELLVPAINSIANLGGTFVGPYTHSLPRKGTIAVPAKVKKQGDAG